MTLKRIIWTVLGLTFILIEVIPFVIFYRTIINTGIILGWFWFCMTILFLLLLIVSVFEFRGILDIGGRFLPIIISADIVAALLTLIWANNNSIMDNRTRVLLFSMIIFSLIMAVIAIAFDSKYQKLRIRHGSVLLSISYLIYSLVFTAIFLLA